MFVQNSSINKGFNVDSVDYEQQSRNRRLRFIKNGLLEKPEPSHAFPAIRWTSNMGSVECRYCRRMLRLSIGAILDSVPSSRNTTMIADGKTTRRYQEKCHDGRQPVSTSAGSQAEQGREDFSARPSAAVSRAGQEVEGRWWRTQRLIVAQRYSY